ncbi:hypothetical protein MBGDF03_00514 [Thermoplasmatales archaeon SCGC AB-540-F20]|nr:hypothetical protein MBGDF03_00514 [Thermoplasmatales archaeon SCGC AB-540-F20]
MINTLQVFKKVGHSLIGSAQISARMPFVEIGKSAPCIRSEEDAEALLRCNFLDPTVPVEFNILSTHRIQKKLWKYSNMEDFNPDFLTPLEIIANRPSIGYVPPECLSKPNEKGINALKKTGSVGEEVSKLRLKYSDKKFWELVTKTKLNGQTLYEQWIRELLENLLLLKGDLIACAVPIITKDFEASVTEQIKANIDISINWEKLCGRKHREHGLLYSFHLSPTALDKPDLIRKAVMGFGDIFSDENNKFWGVHIHFTDIGLVSRKRERIDIAKDLVRKIADISRKFNRFTLVSDSGPMGIVFLDQGASYNTYSPIITPRKQYLMGMNKNIDHDLVTYGKVLDLWSYNLLNHNEVKNRQYKVSDTGLYSNIVPIDSRGRQISYRIDFAKPNNVAVMEKLNNLRNIELNKKKNPNPGASHAGKSSDPLITPWA